MKRIILAIITIFALASLLFVINNLNADQEIEIRPIMPVPNVITEHFDAQEELYVVNFFASWCKACLAEHEEIYKIHNDNKVAIYGIALNDFKANIEEMLKHKNPYKKISVDFPIVKLSELNLERIPRILIIYQGNIIYDHAGEINSRVLQKKIMPIFNKIKNTQPER